MPRRMSRSVSVLPLISYSLVALHFACGPVEEPRLDGADVNTVSGALTGGTYVLANKNSNLCLGGDTTKPVGQPCRGGWTSQKFQLTSINAGFWQIRHPYSGKYLGDNLTVLEWETCNTTWWSQDWALVAWGPAGAEHYVIKNRYSGKSLASSFSNPLFRETYNTSNWSQAWELLPFGVTELSSNTFFDKKCITRYTNETARAFVYPETECGTQPANWGLLYYDSSETVDTTAPVLPLHYGTSGTDWGHVLKYGLAANGNNWTVSLGTDYVNYRSERWKYYNWFDIADNITPSILGSTAYYVDFEIKFLSNTNVQAAVHSGTPPQFHSGSEMGKSRIALGAHGVYNGTKELWLEWVLWNSNGAYDGCHSSGYSNGSWWGNSPTVCDPTNDKYDRRTFYGSGETKYFSPTGLSKLPGVASMPAIAPASGIWYPVRLPLSKLFLNDSTGWYIAQNANLLTLDLIYLGIESHGKSAAQVEVRNWRVYKVGQ